LESTVQYLLALVIAAVSAWVITLIGAGTLERAVSAFAQLVGGWRPDPWPRGVQEEDTARPWAAARSAISRLTQASIETSAGPVPSSRIKARTRPR
jgi:hypothetical protein